MATIKTDIISGFLGAGKTTLIKRLIKEAYAGEKVVLIENEFGQIGIDGGFMRDAGIEINEINSGCICCSLVGDFGKALREVAEKYSPDRIVVEPSGVGKLSDVALAVESAKVPGLVINSMTTVVDATKCKVYIRNFGEFFIDQIEHATAVFLSHTDKAGEEKTAEAVSLVREHNATVPIVVTSLDEITSAAVLKASETGSRLEEELEKLKSEVLDGSEAHGHHHHHHDDEECDDPDCECHHHHHDDDDDDDDDDEECHHHHHDDDDDDEEEHEGHHHHHHDGEECDDPDCECHHHHGHDADDVFTSWGAETPRSYTRESVADALAALDSGKYGQILRAKGYVPDKNNAGEWIHFDMTPGEFDIRKGGAMPMGRLCVIGASLDKAGISALFGV